VTGAVKEITVCGVWLAALSQAEWAAGSALLDERERERWRRFRDQQAACQFLAGRGLLRRMLARQTGADPAAFSIGVAAGGRPFIESPAAFRALSFSISHTAEVAACVVFPSGEVGTDVERPPERVDLLRLAQRFNPVETARLQACPEGERAKLFLEIWTLKEAFIKARGLGFAMALHGFWFDRS
jgi:4'-phosphopantetheinyl transferase